MPNRLQTTTAEAEIAIDATSTLAYPPPGSVVIPTSWESADAGTVPEFDLDIWADEAIELTAAELLAGRLHAAPTVVTDGVDVDVADSGAGALTIDVVAAAKTYTRTGGSFVTDGFVAGQVVLCSGFANAGNNGYKTIDTVAATILTMTSATGLVNESGDNDERVLGPIISTTTGEITSTAHGLLTGDGPMVVTSDDTVPTGFEIGGYVVKVSDDVFQLAATRAESLLVSPTPILPTDSGVGTVSVTGDADDAERVHYHSMGLLTDPIELTADRAYTRRCSHRPGVICYALVGTLDTGELWYAVTPVQER